MMRLSIFASFIAALGLACGAAGAHAQSCSTCATPTVAYAPVAVAAPATVTYTPYRGWYPGKMLDSWRLRRWTAQPTYTAAYVPAPAYATSYAPYSAGYAPYNAGYAPYTASYASYTAGYAPYVTAYAPLQTPVAQTSYYVPAAAVSACSSCATASYAPAVTAAYAPAIVAAPACSDGCSGCSSCATSAAYAPAPACSSCGTPTYEAPVAPAEYSVPATSGCSSCAAASPAAYTAPAGDSAYGGYSVPSSGGATSAPLTPQPSLKVPTPAESNYAPTESTQPLDPGPAADDEKGTSTNFEAPRLLNPNGDRTASRPTVDVWSAVYTTPAAHTNVSTGTTVNHPSTQAQADAAGWTAVPTAN